MTDQTVVAPVTTDTATATAAPADWLASLTPELKTVVEAKGYKTPADVVQAYAHAQKAIGADKILAPKDGVWDPSALEKLGVPKELTEYQKALKRPEMPEGVKYDEQFEAAALPALQAMGIPPAAAQKLLDMYAGNIVAQHDAHAKASAAAQAESQAALKTEWGNAYDQKINFASRAVLHIGGQELVDAMNQTGVGNNPLLVKAFAKVGEMLGEDTLKIGKADGMRMTPAEALSEANKIMRSEDYNSPDPNVRKLAVDKAQALFAQAYPETKAQ
jgi:hypothetical protein